MKWLLHLLVIGALGAGWFYNYKSQHDAQKKIAAIEDRQNSSTEDQDKVARELENAKSAKDEKGFAGFLLSFLTAGYVGLSFVTYALPAIAHKFTHAVYDSGEEVEADLYQAARSKLAQGDYEGAIEGFREAAANDPENRMAWVEIVKIQKEQLHDPAAAIQTLRGALENHAWAENDAAFLLFRLAELYDEEMADRTSGAAILEQVIGQFPGTRHAANARHKLHEWGLM